MKTKADFKPPENEIKEKLKLKLKLELKLLKILANFRKNNPFKKS